MKIIKFHPLGFQENILLIINNGDKSLTLY